MKLKIESITWELDETRRSSVWGTGGAPSSLGVGWRQYAQ